MPGYPLPGRVFRAFAASLLLVIATDTPKAKTGDALRIEEGRDLKTLATKASDRNMAILLVFGTADCIHCAWLEERVLKPMLRSGDYEDRLLIRKLRLDKNIRLLNFSGAEISTRRLAERYSVHLAPTVVLLDAGGMPLANPIVGVPNRHFYARQLDKAIDEALLRVRSKPKV